MIYVEGGNFEMGFPRDLLRPHEDADFFDVELGSFYIGETEVTQALWEKVMGTNPSYNKKCPECPIENISWNSAQKFIKKLNKITGKNYALPMEYQWEYAARGGVKSKGYIFAGTNDMMEADFDLMTYHQPSKYGKKGSSFDVKLGIKNELDMYGLNSNVSEMCFDWYREDFSKKPFWFSNYKVVQGGCYFNPPSELWLRSASPPSLRKPTMGFRLCLTPASSQAKGRTKELFHDTQEPAFWK